MPPVYLDHNATTPLDERVWDAMLPYFRESFGNASGRHGFGRVVRKAVDDARERVAEAVGAHPSQVVFVSGGTEANNLLIRGVAGRMRPSRICVSAIEHPCVLKPARELQGDGWDVRQLAVDERGRVQRADLEVALREPTALVSVMLANNETGVVQDVAGMAELAHQSGALMHTDAVQALGKIPVDFGSLGVHALTLSAHKCYGPKGAGALVLDKRLDLRPQITGGGHEKGLRAGTENVPAIVGFGVACELARRRLQELPAFLGKLRERLEEGLLALGAVVFGGEAERLPNTVYFGFPGIDGETLVMALDRVGFAVASGAACSSGSTDPSPVLLAMGVKPELARTAIRVSLGKDNEMKQMDEFVRALRGELARLRGFAAVAV
jgi:cysteine desulfurase